MPIIATKDKEKLYKFVKYELGYPLRPFEIKDEMLNGYLEMVIEDYSAMLNQWLLHQQWVALEGKDKTTDFFVAFTTKSEDYMHSFTYAYSKQVGLGTNAPADSIWELKRDYITTTKDTQHYIIPANREVNEVLWETPSEIDMGLSDPFSLNVWSPGMHGWSYLGRPAMYVQPTYSTLLTAQDRRMKQRVLQSLLTYRITGLADGRKILHLYPRPGEKNEINSKWGKHYAGRKVWYWYYDTKGDKEKCVKDNPDVVILPSDAPADVLRWDQLNDVAKQQIRNLLIAKVKMVIGGIRGFYEGELGATDKSLKMDYRHLLDEGKELKDTTEKEVKELLGQIDQANLVKERAEIAENLNKERSFQPFRTPIIPI